jgi:hypothetical protein
MTLEVPLASLDHPDIVGFGFESGQDPSQNSNMDRAIWYFIWSLTFVLVALPFSSQKAVAQSGPAFEHEVSLQLGSLLPNQIRGVTEIMPTWGLGYATSTRAGALEVTGIHSNAYGASLINLGLGLRGEFPTIDQFSGLVFGGFDVMRYKPFDEESSRVETGMHIGVGVLMFVSDSLWLRGDLRFQAGPGTSLLMGFSVVVRPGGA